MTFSHLPSCGPPLRPKPGQHLPRGLSLPASNVPSADRAIRHSKPLEGLLLPEEQELTSTSARSKLSGGCPLLTNPHPQALKTHPNTRLHSIPFQRAQALPISGAVLSPWCFPRLAPERPLRLPGLVKTPAPPPQLAADVRPDSGADRQERSPPPPSTVPK